MENLIYIFISKVIRSDPLKILIVDWKIISTNGLTYLCNDANFKIGGSLKPCVQLPNDWRSAFKTILNVIGCGLLDLEDLDQCGNLFAITID